MGVSWNSKRRELKVGNFFKKVTLKDIIGISLIIICVIVSVLFFIAIF